MPKTRIYRREFNVAFHSEGKASVRQLVATFTESSTGEAELLLGLLQQLSTSFSDNETVKKFGKWRYTLEVVPDAPSGGSEKEGIQVDTSAAKPTKRPISYQFSWEIKHNRCQCIAWHRLYGTIRGVVEDSPAGRKLFRNRIMAVWPNAEISTK